jgi:hypothetical protein
MANLGVTLAIVLGVNIMLWLGQVAVLDLNPAGPAFYNCEDSMIGAFEAQNCQSTEYVLNDANPNSQLPTGTGTITTSEGNIFTDTFSIISSWFSQSTGVKYVYNIVAAPSNFLKAIGVPSEFAFAVGAFWYGFTFFIIVAFIMGRDY